MYKQNIKNIYFTKNTDQYSNHCTIHKKKKIPNPKILKMFHFVAWFHVSAAIIVVVIRDFSPDRAEEWDDS